MSEVISDLDWGDATWVQPLEAEIVPGFYTRYGIYHDIYVVHSVRHLCRS